MEHTTGEVEVIHGVHVQGKGRNGKPICGCPADYKTVKEACANAERIAALWNAADGMTNEEAAKYLKHGYEMQQMLKGKCHDCAQDNKRDRSKNDNCKLLCRVPVLLAKLEVK